MKFLSDILAKAGLTVDGIVTLNNVANATIDTEQFLVLDNGVVKYRTGAELLSDIGGNIYTTNGSLTSNRTVNLNGFTLSFSADIFVNGLTLGRGPGGAVTNVAFGSNALRDNVLSGGQNGTRNTAIGWEALSSNTSGFTNTAVGERALRLLSSGTDNTAVGSTSLSAITSGSRNVSVGSHTGIITSGSSNIFIGVFSGGTALTSGSTNIFIGNHQGSGISGNANNNTFIGSGFTGLTADLSNNIIIGDGSGNQRIRVFSNGNVVIGQSSPVDAGFRLDVNGTGRVTGEFRVSDIIISLNNGNRIFEVPNFIDFRVAGVSVGGFSSTSWNFYNRDIVNAGGINISSAVGSTGVLTIQQSATVNHLRQFLNIRGVDNLSNSHKGTTIRLFGGNAQLGFGDIVLAFDGTNKRGNVLIGTDTDISSAILNITSTTQGVLIPRMTSTQRDAISTPATGLEIYNTSTNVFNYYNGTSWVSPLVVGVNVITDYDYDITGNRNSVNKVFTLRNNYISGTTRVFINGVRLTPGSQYDYVETAPNQITFTNAPDNGDLITVDYIRN